MQLTLADIAAAMGTSVDAHPGPLMQGVSIDSRSIQAGDLFFCIQGQQLDGHEFALQAVAAGAGAVVASQPLELAVPVLLVRNTTEALGRLARFWREQYSGQVIGITGSAGKTSVKEMLAQVLALQGETGKNYRNFNNQIGLPLSILNMSGAEDFWVLELGISEPGDMDQLGYILAPDVAVVLNIGPAHLSGLGTVSGVAQEKMKLLDYLSKDGWACLNADYPELIQASSNQAVPLIWFSGSGQQADYGFLKLNSEVKGSGYQMNIHGQSQTLDLPAQFYVPENIAAVLAVAVELGLDPAIVLKGLRHYVPVQQRFVQNSIGLWDFIDDTYNANPMSMALSITQAQALAQDRRLVLVLGDMLELGDLAAQAHRQLGQHIAATRASHCFFYGQHGPEVRQGLGGFQGQFISLTNAEQLLQALHQFKDEPGVILFKGSRSCKMENFYTFLERNWE